MATGTCGIFPVLTLWHRMMMSVAVSKTCKGELNACCVNWPKHQVDGDYWTHVLGQGLLPHITAKCGHFKLTLQQDDVSLHTAQNISHAVGLPVTWECRLQSAGREAFNSSDLNAVNYAIWELQERVYHGKSVDTVDQLKQMMVLGYLGLPQHFSDHSIGEWRHHLQSVSYQNHGHVEHTFH